jgi:hypothetical protein
LPLIVKVVIVSIINQVQDSLTSTIIEPSLFIHPSLEDLQLLKDSMHTAFNKTAIEKLSFIKLRDFSYPLVVSSFPITLADKKLLEISHS